MVVLTNARVFGAHPVLIASHLDPDADPPGRVGVIDWLTARSTRAAA